MTPLVDYVVSHIDVVDPNAIALYSNSIGGYLPPRTAAFESRRAAISALDGICNFGGLIERFPPEAIDIYRKGSF